METTRWTLIRGAAQGNAGDRTDFVRRYEPIVRAYLGARWRGTPLADEVADAAQEVFVACFVPDGALARVDPEGPGKFRAFLYGVTRNIARRVEEGRAKSRERQALTAREIEHIRTRDESLATVFDRAWAMALLQRARRLHRERARMAGGEAMRRFEILELRFGEDLPIREIASRWNADPARLHHEYARARREFAAALQDVVREESGDPLERVDEECRELLAYL